MEHLSNDHEDHPNQHENNHKLCDETGHPIVNLKIDGMAIERQWKLMKSQWKLRQQHDLKFPMEGKPL